MKKEIVENTDNLTYVSRPPGGGTCRYKTVSK